MALGVLLLAVLGLVLVDGVPLLAQRRVDVVLLGLGVRDVQRGEGPADGVPVRAAVAQRAEQRLEPAVVVEDQVERRRPRWGAQVQSGHAVIYRCRSPVMTAG